VNKPRGSQEPLGFTWGYRDFLTSLSAMFMALSILALLTTAIVSKTLKPQGDLVITLEWNMTSNSDIDLWVEAPGDSPVGYQNMSGKHCNLVRDDLGRSRDPASRNEEMTICRGTIAGQYIVNVVAFKVYDNTFPVDATVEVKRVVQGGTYTIAKKTVKLKWKKDQETVFRFTLDSKGALVPGSINSIPMMLFKGGYTPND